MGLSNFFMVLVSLAAAGAEIEIESASEQFLYIRDGSGSVKSLDVFSVNSVPILTYDDRTQTFIINGRVTDGRAELGEEEVNYYKNRVQGFQGYLRDTMSELRRRTNTKVIANKKPTVHIYTEEEYAPRKSNTLYCYAEKFYPFEIELTFLINGRKFAGPVHSSQLVVESDWTFNILKYIRIEPRDGDTFSCRAAHISLDGALTVSLDQPPLPVKSGIIVCAVGVIVGVVGLLVTLYLSRKIHQRREGVRSGQLCKK